MKKIQKKTKIFHAGLEQLAFAFKHICLLASFPGSTLSDVF